MAGAVSAGAYTAGVLDFLFEALAAWEQAKEKALAEGRSDIPDHQVVIDAMSGASAGGICSALATMLPTCGFHPVHTPTSEEAINNNVLYQSWVKGIDIKPMLDTGDMKQGALLSLLNGKALDDIADAAIRRTVDAANRKQGRWPAWLADGMPVFLCLTNTAGVPYLLDMNAGGVTSRGQGVVVHSDIAIFRAGTDPTDSDGVRSLPLNCSRESTWKRLTDACLATAAFPIGLPARRYTQERRLYETALWKRYNGLDSQAPTTIRPDWPATDTNHDVSFYALDGGVTNNEPLELVRSYLAANGGRTHNPRSNDDADAAVLLIDPFPSEPWKQPDHGTVFDITDSISTLAGSLKNQTHFNSQDIILALSDNVFSRYLIAPLRTRDDGKQEGESDLGSKGLGAFAGFVHEAIREHDFFLGRLNCQRFLERHFSVSVTNPIVASWVQRLPVTTHHQYYASTYDATQNTYVPDPEYVRLIPLVGSCDPESQTPYVPPYPNIMFESEVQERLQQDLERRAAMIIDTALDPSRKNMNFIQRFMISVIRVVYRPEKKLAKNIIEIVNNDFRARKLLE